MFKQLCTLMIGLALCVGVNADSIDRDRAKAQKMRTDVLERLYKEEPDTREDIGKAAGYAVFSNVGVNVVFFSAAGGNGIAHDNNTGKDTYMNMASAGLGIGLGIKDFRAVFVFHTRAAYKTFIDKGWDFSGQADAAAKSTDKGDEGSAAITVIPGVSVYQLTEAGLALQATLQGTKYWKNTKLNN